MDDNDIPKVLSKLVLADITKKLRISQIFNIHNTDTDDGCRLTLDSFVVDDVIHTTMSVTAVSSGRAAVASTQRSAITPLDLEKAVRAITSSIHATLARFLQHE